MSCNKYSPGGNIRVLTLGAQESWRVIKVPSGISQDQDDIPLKHSIKSGVIYSESLVQGGICINGVVYFHEILSNFIMSFNVRSETFDTIKKPDGACGRLDRYVITYALINYQGKLAWICCRSNRLWVLEEAKSKLDWSLSYLNPLNRDPSTDDDDQMIHSSKHYFSGVTHAHEVIYMPKNKKKPFCALYHDLKSNSTRQVAYQEINHKWSYCDDYGSPGFKEMFNYDYFPNHIENIMSLKSLGLADS
ncbi:PREDICTED: putative F-box protein At4g21240 [Camelina sativa]|nr:PREDICTED: putative F-box protein At4g21240 [Camelina sativa]